MYVRTMCAPIMQVYEYTQLPLLCSAGSSLLSLPSEPHTAFSSLPLTSTQLLASQVQTRAERISVQPYFPLTCNPAASFTSCRSGSPLFSCYYHPSYPFILSMCFFLFLIF